jgi:hypothetical protein
VERVVMIARLKPDARERARELVEQHQAGHYASAEFERQAIFLAPEEVIFFVEGPDAARTVRGILNDPVRSTELGHWIPLFDGPLHAAPEAYYWERA